jgi:hypothetical protein
MAITQTNTDIAPEVRAIVAKLTAKEQIELKDLLSFLPEGSEGAGAVATIASSTLVIDYVKNTFTLKEPSPVIINAGPAHINLNSDTGIFNSSGDIYTFTFPDNANSPRGSAIFGIKIRLISIQINSTQVIASFDKEDYVVNYVAQD